MRAIYYMALKDLRLLLRDWAGLFWLLAFPLIMALFFGSIFGGFGDSSGRGKISVAFVDNTDGMPYAGEFKSLLDSTDVLSVTATSFDSAQAAVRRGNKQAYIALSPDTTTGGQSFGMYPGGIPRMAVGIDPSRRAESGILKGMLTQAHFTLIMKQFTDPANAQDMISASLSGIDTATSLRPEQKRALTDLLEGLNSFFSFEAADTTPAAGGSQTDQGPFKPPDISVTEVTRQRVGPRSSFEITFPQALMWGLLGCVAAFSISIVTERTRGTFLRLRLAPLIADR